MKNSYWLLAIGYWLLSFCLALYSYSQIDLNLTLSSNRLYQTIQKQLIYLGYFNRSLSFLIYLILVFLLFFFYFLLLLLVKRKKISEKKIWILILGNVAILLFSYPAFSHDIFNYIFDARILLFHQANPWRHTALDFADDLWTRFMHWTHRTYPYGPVWLAASILPYFLALGKFVLTLFLFKLMLALAFLGSCILIFKIVSRAEKRALLALTFFAFNPLVLLESLVSPHLDIFMTFLGLLAIFLIVEKRKLLGFFSLVLSVGVKYATAGFLPFFLIRGKKKILAAILLTLLAIVAQISLREILPWYFIPLIALLSLSDNRLLEILFFGLSLGGVLYYLPYLYIGEYNNIVKTWRLYLFFVPILLSFVVASFVKRKPFQERSTQDKTGKSEK